MLDIDAVINNENNKIKLTFNRNTVRGWVTEDFKIGLSNEFDDIMSISGIDNLEKQVNKVLTLLGKSAIQMKTPFMTSKTWSSSSVGSFSVPLLFYRKSIDDISPIKQLQILSATSLPILKSVTGGLKNVIGDLTSNINKNNIVGQAATGIINTGLEQLENVGFDLNFFSAPLNYAPPNATANFFNNPTGMITTKNQKSSAKTGVQMKSASARGTITLEVGSWFRARGLICKSLDFIISKEIVADGTPLYVKANLQVEPYRMWALSDFLNCFIKK